MTLSRRQFLTIAGGGAASGVTVWLGLPGGETPAAIGPTSTSTAAAPINDGHVLVLLQMAGGNDGLNTLVPAGDGRYYDLRPTLGIKEADVVVLPGIDHVGLHPALAPLLPLFARGDLAWVEGVGFQGASRSHFQAMDSWWTAALQDVTTGWLGRWLDVTAGAGPLRGVALGGGAPVLRAVRSPSTLVLDAERFTLPRPMAGGLDAMGAASRGESDLMAEVRRSLGSTVDAVGVIGDALAGRPADAASGPFASGLAVAAELVALDAGASVIVVESAGFDTHAAQAGRHAELLADVAGGIAAFFAAGDAGGWSDRVVLMTSSEFGRRAAENGSGGCDHGLAAAHLIAGPAIAGGVVTGGADLAALIDGDLAPTVDPRSLDAVALDWLGGPTDDILAARYDRLDLLT
jgi:uncharacterized protein (DUF1501 family)